MPIRLPSLLAGLQVAALITEDTPGNVQRANPFVDIWDSGTQQRRQRLFHGSGTRAVQCLAFSPRGNSLATVCTDDAHTMSVWSWREGQCLLQRKTRPGTPPSVYGIVWSPFETDRLASYGQNHVFFWRLCKDAAYGEMKVRMHFNIDDGCLARAGRAQIAT